MEHSITFLEAFWVWVKVAVYSFGGPAGQIAVMHRILVEEKRWVSEERFLHALNYAMLLPGPEAQQLTVYIGWLLHKTWGGVVAGTLFVLPGFASILALSILYATFQDVSFVQGLFFGLKPAVMAIVVEAVMRIGRRALKNRLMVIVAGLAFVAIFFFDVPFPLIILSAAGLGFLGHRITPAGRRRPTAPPAEPSTFNLQPSTATPVIADVATAHARPSLARALRVLAICLPLWFGPLLLLAAVFGADSVFVQEGVFFSKTAVVTFGGAYAVLAYVAQQAVDVYGWLRPGEMLDGLGMAETTPGPLISVVQFVAFLGAYRHPGLLSPLAAGVLGSLITTWVTYVPCFLWIFLGAPYVEQLRGNQSLSAALTAITAAVVGVILNLAVWFSLHTLFDVVNEVHTLGLRLLVPDWATLDGVAAVIAVGAFLALFRFRWGMMKTLAVSAATGLVYYLLFGN
ncbi:MAG: chromate efflux transporter [Chloroflexota bacterium]